jgi:hypothetical protein
MYIISFASCVNQLTIGKQYVRDTLNDAIDCAVTIVMSKDTGETERGIRQELTNDMEWIDVSGEYGVFITQPK